MDYDDNDISRHNLQLVEEGRTKSSKLRPYDFPKSDFDNNRQGHLRFDSLVETEVFLGIQREEDNHWIEDFSRGSNGMEFNSTPADSCSIARRNSVWSEATSSESVEMLLNSVGPEEMMPGDSFIPGSKLSHDQGTFAQHVEPASEIDLKHDGYCANSETTLSQEKHRKNHSAPQCHVQEQLPQVKGPSGAQGDVEPVCEEGYASVYASNFCHEETSNESKITDEMSMNCEARSDSSHFTGAGSNINPGSNIGILEQVNTGSEHGDKVLEGFVGEASTPNCAEDSSTDLVVKSGEINSEDAVTTSDTCVEESALIATGGASKLKSSEGDDKIRSFNTCSQIGAPEVENLPRMNEDICLANTCHDGTAVDGADQHSADVSSLNAEQCASPEHKMNFSTLLTCKQVDGKFKEVQTSPGKEDSTHQLSLFSKDDYEAPVDSSDCVDKTRTNTSSDMVMLCSAAEDKETENVDGCLSDSIVTVDGPGAQFSTAVVDDSKQEIEDGTPNRRTDFSEPEPELCYNKEGDIVVEIVDLKTPISDKRSQSDLSVGVKVNNVADHATSHAGAEQDDLDENRKQEPVLIGLTHLVNTIGDGFTRNVSDTNVGIQVATTTKVEVSEADDTARRELSKMSTMSPPNVGYSNHNDSNKSSEAESIKFSLLNHSQTVLCDDKSSLKESVKAVDQEPKMMKIEGEEESIQASEVDKTSCGSPTIISSSEPLQMEKNNQDEASGSEVRDVLLASEDPKRTDVTIDDSTFTFKVSALPDTSGKTSGNSWLPFPTVEKCESPVVFKDTSKSGEKTACTPTQKSPRKGVPMSDGEHVRRTSKATSERKGRRTSTKGIAKEDTKSKGSQVDEATQESANGGKSSEMVEKTSASDPNTQAGKVQPYAHIEQSNIKHSGGAAVPDLNASALNKTKSVSNSCQQTFTDSQQVQLRAQIFVYGSLIQGMSPDEACMVSAFGSNDGRNIWEPVWRVAVERIRKKNSSSGVSETSPHSESATRASDVIDKQSSHSSKVLSSPMARSSSKGSPAAIVNPIIPLSSPLWRVSTPSCDSLPSSGTLKGPIVDYHHAVTPMHSYQTPSTRSFIGHTSWPSPPCFSGPWRASPQTSTFNPSARFQPVVMTETVKLTPVKETSRPMTSGMKLPTSSPVQTVVPSSSYVAVSFPDTKLIATAEKHSKDPKPRKRKKVKASDLDPVSLPSEASTKPVDSLNYSTSNKVLASALTSLSSSVPITTTPATCLPAFPASDAVLREAAADPRPPGSMERVEKGFSLALETLSKVAEAESQAEDAATFAAKAVSHSEDLWGQLAKQKGCRLNSEVEVNLASAAIAISAASSVAKAAAAAAKVACNVALQAKQMADEAFLSGETSGLVSSISECSVGVHDVGNTLPGSILKGDAVINQSSSVLVAAEEVANSRISAASAAPRQAENLDAIVRAAELTALAVSEAGKIVAMREPMALNALIEAGPEGYWKLTASTLLAGKLRESNNAAAHLRDSDIPGKGSMEDSDLKEGLNTVGHGKIHPRERSKDTLVSNFMYTSHTSETDLRIDEEFKAFDTSKSARVSERRTVSGTGCVRNEHDDLVGTIPEGTIKKGCSVEVFKHGDGLNSAWYSANVLTLEDRKVYVCYTDILTEKGSGNLCEWVPLEVEGDKEPIIRAALPITGSQSQGTRKRRRAALGDYAWCVGDKVDVWVDDCWWEGVVTEKDEKDETTLKVHFPAQGDTLTVKAWNLRRSCSWNNGKWVECCSSEGHNSSEQRDTPKEKRQRLGSPTVTSKARNKLAVNVDSASGIFEGSKLLQLSTSDRVFNVGEATTVDNKFAGRRPLRTGKQKEGSRVIVGVPKPTGKKRKFMDVSKHFTANKSGNSTEANDSVKFVKYLMPQATAARGWKGSMRSDSNEKLTAQPRSRVTSSRKSNRSLPQRNDFDSAISQKHDNLRNHGKDNEDSTYPNEETSEKLEIDFSAAGEASEAPLSSLISHPPSTSKVFSSNKKFERLMRGKPAITGGRLGKIEENGAYSSDSGQTISETTEPRRSNRRIQPTHRLLEGLQSSIIIPKMPSISYGKVQRNPSRNVSSRGK